MMLWFFLGAVLVALPICHKLKIRRDIRAAEQAQAERFAYDVEFWLVIRDRG